MYNLLPDYVYTEENNWVYSQGYNKRNEYLSECVLVFDYCMRQCYKTFYQYRYSWFRWSLSKD